jgi:hypothetical protein
MWLRICTIVLGIWLLLCPAVLGSSADVAMLDRIAGPVVVVVAVLALRDVTRAARMANIFTGLFVLIAIPASHSATTLDLVNTFVVGWLLIGCTIPRGAIHRRTGGGWWAIMRPAPDRYPDI